jgi:hypothetical protein
MGWLDYFTGFRWCAVMKISILQVRVSSTFMLDPDLTLLLSHLANIGYVVASTRVTLGGATVTPVMPPNVIAVKGNVIVDYDFGRRSLGVEGRSPQEVILALQDLWKTFEDLRIDVEKALVPYEAIVVALTTLNPRFSSNRVEAVDVIGYNLRMVEASFVLEDGDPTSHRWLYVRIIPVYSSFRPGEGENLYRIEIVYRDERGKILKFIEDIEGIIGKILERV